MPNELTVQRYPWEPVPAPSTDDVVEALRRDFAYAVENTAIAVHSTNPAFRMLVNTRRGQLVPRNECKFSDGTTVELQDIGMCQPGANVPHMTVREIMTYILELAKELNLELVQS